MMTRHDFPRRPGAEPVTPLMHISGAAAGPRLVVTGPRNVLEPLAHLFWDRTDLVSMSGVLILRLEHEPVAPDRPDHLLSVDGNTARAARLVLARMVALDMIPEGGGTLLRVA